MNEAPAIETIFEILEANTAYLVGDLSIEKVAAEWHQAFADLTEADFHEAVEAGWWLPKAAARAARRGMLQTANAYAVCNDDEALA